MLICGVSECGPSMFSMFRIAHSRFSLLNIDRSSELAAQAFVAQSEITSFELLKCFLDAGPER